MKNFSRVLSIFLTIILVIGMVPMTALTAFADDTPVSITGISLKGVPVPKAGEYAGYLYGANLTESTADKNKYEIIDNQDICWRDEEGRAIEYSRYYFEAGRTYSISFNIKPKDGYVFDSADIPAQLFDLYPYQYASSVELLKGSSTTYAKVTFTFEVAGERTYDDITNVYFYKILDLQDGDKTQLIGLVGYNNSEMRDRWWSDSNGNYLESETPLVGGNTYYYNFIFKAFDGYHFADEVLIRNDNNIKDWKYTLSVDKTQIHIKIPFYITTAETITSVVIDDMFIPAQGGLTRSWDTNVHLSVPEGANYSIHNQTVSWYETKAESATETEHKVKESMFIAGKEYKMFLLIYTNDGYKFPPPENVSISFSGIPEHAYTYTCESGGSSEGIITAVVTFTAQFPNGAGYSADDPAVCTTYSELKFALQHPTIQYIRVNNFTNSNALSYYILTEGEDYFAGNSAIKIPLNAEKDLEINTDINLRATQLNGRMYSLIYNTGSLYVHGTGSLNVSFNAQGYISAIILNDGELKTTGITLDGTNYSFDRQHGYAIVNYSGNTTIYGGTYIGYKSAAVSHDRGSLTIYGGTFKIKEGAYGDFGLNTDGHNTVQEHKVKLYGGTFEGIRASQSSGVYDPKLRDLLPYNAYLVKDDNSKFDVGEELETNETLTVKLYPLIEEVNPTVIAPREGYTPSAVARDNTTYSVNNTKWMVSDTGENGTWKAIDTSTKFVAGKYYKLIVDLKASKDYCFKINESLDPDVTATVNGYNAKVSRVYEQESRKYICVEYNFGVCNKTVIESVIIENIVAPVVDELPTYTCSYAGTGYGYYTDVDNGTYQINGIVWYDVTNGSNTIVWYDDVFKAGHTYKLQVTARVQDGFNFADSVFSTVNGDGNVTAKVNNGIWCTVTYKFTCQPKTISSIAVTELNRPVGGANPDFSAVTDSKYYTVESIVWYDYENGMEEMTESDTFIGGNTYHIIVTVVPTKDNGSNTCEFATQKIKATLNGIEVVKTGNWNDISGNYKSINIWYTFTAASNGVFVGGTVNSFGEESDTVTLHLIPENTSEVAYETTATGNNSTYLFTDVAAGTYILKIAKPYHAVYETVIVVSNNDVIHNVELEYLISTINYGDVNDDGKINNKDYAMLKR